MLSRNGRCSILAVMSLWVERLYNTVQESLVLIGWYLDINLSFFCTKELSHWLLFMLESKHTVSEFDIHIDKLVCCEIVYSQFVSPPYSICFKGAIRIRLHVLLLRDMYSYEIVRLGGENSVWLQFGAVQKMNFICLSILLENHLLTVGKVFAFCVQHVCKIFPAHGYNRTLLAMYLDI